MEDGVIIYADVHETSSNIAHMLSNKCMVIEKAMAVGDYQLSSRVAAERKTVPDFIASIMDGRLFRQLHELKEEFDVPVLVIEGESLFSSEGIHPNALRGALASVIIDIGAYVVWTRNASETAEMLFAIAKREQIKEGGSITVRGKRKFRSENQMQEFLLSGLPKISTAKAKALLKHFGTPLRVLSASEEELMQVKGVGKTLAKSIRLLLDKKYEKSILED